MNKPDVAAGGGLWTQGPLYVSGVRTTMDRQRWLRVICEAENREVAFIPFGDRTPNEYRRCMADARLYAAAPDLYEALEALVGPCLSYQGNSIVITCDSHGWALKRVLEARDALSKAKGE